MPALTDDDVVAALTDLGMRATALALCENLVGLGNTRRDSQIAIQRACEHGRIAIETNWMLAVLQQSAVH